MPHLSDFIYLICKWLVASGKLSSPGNSSQTVNPPSATGDATIVVSDYKVLVSKYRTHALPLNEVPNLSLDLLCLPALTSIFNTFHQFHFFINI